MLVGDLAVLADDEGLRHAVDAPVDRRAAGFVDADRLERIAEIAEEAARVFRLVLVVQRRRSRSACPATAPCSTGCSSRQGAHHDAKTLTSVTLPAKCSESSPGRSVPSSGGRSVCGAGWPISAEGTSEMSRPDRSCDRNSPASAEEDQQRQQHEQAAARASAFRLSVLMACALRLVGTAAHAGRFQFRQFALARALVEQDPADQPGQRNGRDAIGGRDVERVRAHAARPRCRRSSANGPSRSIMPSLSLARSASQSAATPQPCG